jgi:hypothetical protein
VPLANQFDIAAMNVREIIDSSTKERVRSGRLSCVMKFYSRNPKAVVSATARFAFCHSLMIKKNPH